MGSAGLTCTTADGARAVFLPAEDLAALQESVAFVLDRPTVAGPPLDLPALERVARAFELGAVDPHDQALDPVRLSQPEQDALELLQHQAAVRASLPLRVLHTCVACGSERMINPARQEKKASGQQDSGRLAESVLSSVEWLEAGHPFLATLSFLEGLGGSSTPAGAAAQVCERCDGDEFDSRPVTFCPGCREVRSETVLLTCPDCNFDFEARARHRTFWSSPEDAAEAHRLAVSCRLLTDRKGEFENGLYPAQLAALLAQLSPDDRLVGMCRCRLPGQGGRYVAALFTSEGLVWARQLAMSATTSGRLDWRDVAGLHAAGAGGREMDWGFALAADDGTTLTLIDFRGNGVSLDTGGHTFDPRGIYALVAKLITEFRPSAVPARPHPVVAPPTMPAGWYPDPWRVARLRWWDGLRWVGATSR